MHGAARRSTRQRLPHSSRSTVDDHDVVTVEGLADADDLSDLQRAFVEHDALQCGYCTPGQLCSAVGMLDEVASRLADRR